MVKIGEEISDLEVDMFHEGKIKKVRLEEFRGKWLVILFYPADFTFVCPTELQDAAEFYNQFRAEDAEIVSVSTDTAWAHKAWHDSSPAISKITYPMLADPTGKMCEDFGTYIDEEGVSLRASFIVDPNGILKSIEMHDNSIGRNIEEILRKLKAAVFVSNNPRQVCPARWKPGMKTIIPSEELVGKI